MRQYCSPGNAIIFYRLLLHRLYFDPSGNPLNFKKIIIVITLFFIYFIVYIFVAYNNILNFDSPGTITQQTLRKSLVQSLTFIHILLTSNSEPQGPIYTLQLFYNTKCTLSQLCLQHFYCQFIRQFFYLISPPFRTPTSPSP